MGAVEWWGVAAAAASAVAAGGSWVVAAQSKGIAARAAGTADLALETAQAAARTADSVADIERIRAHHDFAPRFAVKLVQQNPSADSRLTLKLTWMGPGTLERLSEVRVEVRGDGIHRRPALAGSPTAEEISATIWGPYRLQPHVSGASPDGRTAVEEHLELGRSIVLSFERTLHPHWIHPDQWRADQEGQPVELLVTAVHSQFRPWHEVHVLQPERPWAAPAPATEG
ncbi:hypothetical protein ABT224_19625 [Streptomyces sp. NPDC001584]|uniref:hypothetical protein n=1 Tax=Streptomyces sp. NPDC001584 TaxID=3154521 RepID=UPI0033223DBE